MRHVILAIHASVQDTFLVNMCIEQDKHPNTHDKSPGKSNKKSKEINSETHFDVITDSVNNISALNLLTTYILSAQQYGFKVNTSTSYAYAYATNGITTSLDKNHFTMGIFIYFKKRLTLQPTGYCLRGEACFLWYTWRVR